MVAITEFQKIGVGLMGFGLFFLLFGVLLYFDSVLLAFGNWVIMVGDTVEKWVALLPRSMNFTDSRPWAGTFLLLMMGALPTHMVDSCHDSINILFLTGLTFIIGFRRTAHFFFQRHKFRGSFFFLGGVSLVLCRWPIIGMLVESYGFVLLFKSFFPMALGFVLSAVNIPFLSAFGSSSSSMV